MTAAAFPQVAQPAQRLRTRSWRDMAKRAWRLTLPASPLDKPNTALMLKPHSRVRLTHLGVERTALACVFLYVDQPERLIRAVRSERQQ